MKIGGGGVLKNKLICIKSKHHVETSYFSSKGDVKLNLLELWLFWIRLEMILVYFMCESYKYINIFLDVRLVNTGVTYLTWMCMS